MAVEIVNPEGLPSNPAYAQGTVSSGRRAVVVGGQNGVEADGVIAEGGPRARPRGPCATSDGARRRRRDGGRRGPPQIVPAGLHSGDVHVAADRGGGRSPDGVPVGPDRPAVESHSPVGATGRDGQAGGRAGR